MPFTDADLQAFLDEALPAAQMAAIEGALREDAALHRRLAAIRAREDAGVHTIGAIWRRHRLACPDRGELGQYLLGVLDAEPEAYIRFHIERVGCRFCEANLDDLRLQQQDAASAPTRRRRYFETSVGHLR